MRRFLMLVIMLVVGLGAFAQTTVSYTAATASTNATSVKSSNGIIYHISVGNTTSTTYYLRIYNLATAPTCSSATGFIQTIDIPNNAGNGAGREISLSPGAYYSTGIAFCVTGGSSSTDNTNAAAGVYVTIYYR